MCEKNITNLISYNKYRRYCNLNHIDFEEDKEFEKILNARYHKVSRIKKRFLYLFHRYKYLYFCTFTLDNYYINCSDRTRKDLIKDSLYSFDDDIKYIINVDFGKKTERLHYHGIIATNSDLDLNIFLKLTYPCFSYSERIRLDPNSIRKIPKYINKLSNHAVKDSTRNFRTLYNFKGYDKFDKEEARLLLFFDKWKVHLT